MATITEENLATAKQFVELRANGNDTAAFELLADDVVLTNPKGSFTGKDAVTKHMSDTKPTGNWDALEIAGGCARRNGMVRMGFIKQKLVQEFYFNDGGLICKVLLQKN